MTALASTRPLPATGTHGPSFLEGLKLDHGPVPELARFLLNADAAIRERGVTLQFAPMSEIVRVNGLNQASWGPFTPILDSRVAPLPPETSFCLMGVDTTGRPVTVQGVRLFDCAGGTLAGLAATQALYYGDRPLPDDPQTCELTAPIAADLTGRLLYSGALWVHPDVRGQALSALLPRVARVLALGRWRTDWTFTFVSEAIAASKLMDNYGYRLIQPAYTIYQAGRVTYRGSLVWMDRDRLLDDMRAAASRHFPPQVDGMVGDGGGEQKVAAVR
jgi:hypothetical protein